MSESAGVMEAWKDVSTVPTITPKTQQLVDDINSRYTAARDAGEGALAALLPFLNATRDCGVAIDGARATLSPAQYKLAQQQFAFTSQQTQGLLDFARKFPEPITATRAALKRLNEAQMALGFAEYPEGHGPQTLHEHNFALEFTRLVTATRAKLHRELERSPIETWSSSYARQFAQVNAPLVDDLNKLMAEALKRAATFDTPAEE